VQRTFAAGGAFFSPDASFFEYADEIRIKTRIYGLVGVTFGNSAG
jgi:hypothetical protein